MTATRSDHKKLKIDPRIRDRHNKVVRSIGRKRLYLILLVLFVLIGVYGVHLLLRTSFFAVRKFDVVGSTHYATGEIISTSGVNIGMPLTEINPGAVAKRLESMPWNGNVKVKKKWPSTLEVVITGRVPLAVVPQNSTSDLLVDGTGRVLSVQNKSISQNWIRLCWAPRIASSKELKLGTGCVLQNNGPGSFISPNYLGLLKFVADLRSQTTVHVTELASSPTGGIDGLLSNGVAVRFGTSQQIRSKIRSLGLVIKHASMAGYTTVDVRDPQEPVLSKW